MGSDLLLGGIWQWNCYNSTGWQREGLQCSRGATFHAVYCGIAGLPGDHGNGMLIARDAQHNHQIALMVQYSVRAVFSSGYKGAEHHLLPHTCIKELYG